MRHSPHSRQSRDTSHFALALMVPLLIVVAAVWLTYQVWRFFFEPASLGPMAIHAGAVDLRLRYAEVQHWFPGTASYHEVGARDYPPASLLMLWPILGWPSFTLAKMAYALTAVVTTTVLICVCIRGSLAQGRTERAFVGLLPCAIYATGATIGNGQMILLLLPSLLAGLLLLVPRSDERPRLSRDLLGALLVVLALTKPTIAAPFFWIAMFVPRRIRPAALAVGIYGVFTLWASAYRSESLIELQRLWVMNGLENSTRVSTKWSYGNLQAWLTHMGLSAWSLWVALAALLALGYWIYRHRRQDIWLLFGVTGLFSRMWTYHGWYDDLLILPAMIALFRVAKLHDTTSFTGKAARAALLATLCIMVAPGGQYLLPQPWKAWLLILNQSIWLADLALLGYLARSSASGASSGWLSRGLEHRVPLFAGGHSGP